MIGYVLGTKHEHATLLHRVQGSTPGWALCGTFCDGPPNVAPNAVSAFCQACVARERLEEEAARGC